MLKINKINLFLASEKGHGGIVKLLIDAKADLNIQDKHGSTALRKGKSLFIFQWFKNKSIKLF